MPRKLGYELLLASFPGPCPASCQLQYDFSVLQVTESWAGQGTRLTIVAGNIDQLHDHMHVEKTAQWNVKNKEQSCVTTVTSTLANWTDGQPQLTQRIMKALGTFPLPSV